MPNWLLDVGFDIVHRVHFVTTSAIFAVTMSSTSISNPIPKRVLPGIQCLSKSVVDVASERKESVAIVGGTVVVAVAARAGRLYGTLAAGLGVEIAPAAIILLVTVGNGGAVLAGPAVVVAGTADGHVRRRGQEVGAAAIAVVVDLDGRGDGESCEQRGKSRELHFRKQKEWCFWCLGFVY